MFAQMAFRSQKVFEAFEKRTPGLIPLGFCFWLLALDFRFSLGQRNTYLKLLVKTPGSNGRV